MARTKQTARRTTNPFITWTRFYLAGEQEWPTWSGLVDHADIHVGPLAGVAKKVSLGRMVENPEQAACIVEWDTMDALKTFQSSPACVEFLRNLPEHDFDNVQLQDSIASGSALRGLTLDDADTTSVSSRFLTLNEASGMPVPIVEGRVTFTAFLIPGPIGNVHKLWNDRFRDVFIKPVPCDSTFITWYRNVCSGFATMWFWVREEDGWVEKKFGKLEDMSTSTSTDTPARTSFCQYHFVKQTFRPWGITPKREEDLASTTSTRLPWKEAVMQVMPPATAWVQEDWNIRKVPRFYPPEPDVYTDGEIIMKEGNQSVEEDT